MISMVPSIIRKKPFYLLSYPLIPSQPPLVGSSSHLSTLPVYSLLTHPYIGDEPDPVNLLSLKIDTHPSIGDEPYPVHLLLVVRA